MSGNTLDDRRQPKSARRSARQIAAQRREQRRRMMTWGGIAVVAAIILASVLVFANLDDDPEGSSIDFSGIAADGRYLGDVDAPVDFVVYSDFQCPFCKQFDQNDLPKVVDDFVRTGQVRVEWRPMPIISGAQNIPLESDENESMQSSEAAFCAAEQNSFWQYSEAMYAAQGAENSGVFSDDMLKETAADLDLDTEEFNTCLDEGEKQDDVLALRQEGIDSGVQGTPTFLINDQLVNYSLEGYGKLKGQLQDAVDGNLVEG